MSVESMSSGPMGGPASAGGMASVGMETSMGHAGVGSSLDSAIGPTMSLDVPSSVDLGGVHNPEFGNNIFSQTEPMSDIHSDILGTTMEYKAPSFESFDKVAPESMLEKTSVLWQASAENKTEAINNIVEKQAPVVHIADTLPVSAITSEQANNVLEDTVEFKSPIVESFDKVVPEELLADTVSIWQAPKAEVVPAKISVEKPSVSIETQAADMVTKDITEEAVKESFMQSDFPAESLSLEGMTSKAELISEPDSEKVSIVSSDAKDEQAESILDSYLVQELSIDQPQLDTLKMSETQPMQMQELKADALQAVKVKEILVSMGETPEEAEKYAVEAFVRAQEQKGTVEVLKEKKSQSLPPEKPKYEHDAKADKARKDYVLKAVEEVAQKVQKGEEDKITGVAVVEAMPDSQPEEVKSKILSKNSSDGSYEHLIVDLGKINEAIGVEEIDRLVSANHAVEKGASQQTTGNQATKSEVEKVLKGKASLSKV